MDRSIWTAAACKLIILKRNILAFLQLHNYLELLIYNWVTLVNVWKILLFKYGMCTMYPQMFKWKHWGILDRLWHLSTFFVSWLSWYIIRCWFISNCAFLWSDFFLFRDSLQLCNIMSYWIIVRSLIYM